MSLSRLVARPMLASIFVVGGVNALRNAPKLAAKAAPVAEKLAPLANKAAPQAPLPQDATNWIRLNAAAQIAGGLTLATGRVPRLSAALLAATLVPATAAGHRFWEIDDKDQRTQQQLHFFKNVSLFGGLVIAAGDTDGKPGVAWRTRRAAQDAR
ncbi:MAG TPA: DoxX family protein, partial [Nocardioides sp.]|nr:DoxX family protein [Nocardioides sp.]